MFRVAAGKLTGTVNESHGSRIAPLLLERYSFASQSNKTAYSGSEILNYMGGLDNDKKQMVQKLVNFRMKEGKKTKIRSIFHETLHKLARTDRDGVQFISDALENVKPICEVARMRLAGNVIEVPGVVDSDRQQTLAVRWLLDEAKRKHTKSKHRLKLEECLFSEIMDAARKRGKVREKRDQLHEKSATNRSYAHFRWW